MAGNCRRKKIAVRTFEVILSYDLPNVALVGDLKFRGGLEAREGIAAGWIGADKEWRAVGFRKTGIFRPIGAATRDDGMVFLLERRFSTLGGLGTRISVVPGREIAPGIIFKSRELAELSPPLVSDNFEASPCGVRATAKR